MGQIVHQNLAQIKDPITIMGQPSAQEYIAPIFVSGF
jgi:hypothetical protein